MLQWQQHTIISMLLPRSLLLLFLFEGKNRFPRNHSSLLLHRLVSILFAADSKYKIVCYFTNWGKTFVTGREDDRLKRIFPAMKRPGGGSMTPEDIDPCLCTHVIYAFSEMDNNQLTPMEKHDLKDGSQPGRMHEQDQSNTHRSFISTRLLRTIQCLEECEQKLENPAGRWWLGKRPHSMRRPSLRHSFIDTS